MLIDGSYIINSGSPKLMAVESVGLAFMHKLWFICMEVFLDDSSIGNELSQRYTPVEDTTTYLATSIPCSWNKRLTISRAPVRG